MDANPILEKVGDLSFDPVCICARALDKPDERGTYNWQCDIFRRISEPGRARPDDAESFTVQGTPDEIRHMMEEAVKELGLNAPVETSWGGESPPSFSSRRPSSP